MSHRLIILPQAKADVLRNAEWWALHHSSEQAARWLDTIQSQLESIADFPQSHSLSAENDDFPYEIRDKLLAVGMEPATSTPAQFGEFVRSEIGKWARVVKTAGVKPE